MCGRTCSCSCFLWRPGDDRGELWCALFCALGLEALPLAFFLAAFLPPAVAAGPWCGDPFLRPPSSESESSDTTGRCSRTQAQGGRSRGQDTRWGGGPFPDWGTGVRRRRWKYGSSRGGQGARGVRTAGCFLPCAGGAGGAAGAGPFFLPLPGCSAFLLGAGSATFSCFLLGSGPFLPWVAAALGCCAGAFLCSPPPAPVAAFLPFRPPLPFFLPLEEHAHESAHSTAGNRSGATTKTRRHR